MDDNYTWFDLDAQYFMLEDEERTPMSVKWIEGGAVKLESSNGSHVYCGLLKGINEHITIIKTNEI